MNFEEVEIGVRVAHNGRHGTIVSGVYPFMGRWTVDILFDDSEYAESILVSQLVRLSALSANP